MANREALKLDRVAFAISPTGPEWNPERVARPDTWGITSSFSPRKSMGKYNTYQQERILPEWLSISNILPNRLALGDNDPVDVTATAVLNNGTRFVLIWPPTDKDKLEGGKPLCFVSPPTSDTTLAQWREISDPVVKADLGWALWYHIHPDDSELRRDRALFHPTPRAHAQSGSYLLGLAPEIFLPSSAEGALETARDWQKPLTELTERLLGTGEVEYNEAVAASSPAELATLSAGAGSIVISLLSMGYTWQRLGPTLYGLVTGLDIPGADPTLLTVGTGSLLVGMGVMGAPEATQRVRDWWGRSEYRGKLQGNFPPPRWDSNMPPRYSDEVAKITGVRPEIPPEGKGPRQIPDGSRRDTFRLRRRRRRKEGPPTQ
jgi:hypothetical protein